MAGRSSTAAFHRTSAITTSRSSAGSREREGGRHPLAGGPGDGLSGDRAGRRYDLIVFPGHHEYVTTAEYDVVERYRDLGGNLAFLSANNFFWRVDRHGDRLTRIAPVARPRPPRGRTRRRPVLRHGTSGSYAGGSTPYAELELATGSSPAPASARRSLRLVRNRGRRPTSASPPLDSQVVAPIPNAFGTGPTAEMTYYETPTGRARLRRRRVHARRQPGKALDYVAAPRQPVEPAQQRGPSSIPTRRGGSWSMSRAVIYPPDALPS